MPEKKQKSTPTYQNPSINTRGGFTNDEFTRGESTGADSINKALADRQAPMLTRWGGGPCSLGQRAAQVVARNAHGLSSSLMGEAPWTCWRMVWQSILHHGSDLPHLFRIFYQSFGLQSDFMCHYRKLEPFARTHGSARLTKNAALNACLAPTLRHHRLENVFSNVSVAEFASFVLELAEAAVVVDCSGVRAFTPNQLVTLCGTPNLEALDLSNTDIDDQFLYTLRASMVLKKSRLQILRICGCANITETGLRVLLAEPGAPSLAYLESDIHISKVDFAHGLLALTEAHGCAVPGTKWRVVPTSDLAIGVVHKFHLANKLLCLLRNIPKLLAPSLIWDFKFFPQVVEGAHVTEELALEAWNLRLSIAATSPAHVPAMYVKDCSHVAPAQEPRAAPKSAPELLVFSRAGHSLLLEKPKHLQVRKPRTVKTDAMSFFLG